MELSALSPNVRESAPMMILLPAPVSPVITTIPLLKEISSRVIIA
jgi:hypothetical protein